MQYITFGSNRLPKQVVILIPNTHINRMDIEKHYVQPLVAQGMLADNIMAIGLNTQRGTTPVAKCIKPCLDILKDRIIGIGATHVIVCHAGYFKTLTGQRRAEPHIGTSLPAKYWGLTTELNVTYAPSYAQAMYNNQAADKIKQSLQHVRQQVLTDKAVTTNQLFEGKMRYVIPTANERNQVLATLLKEEKLAIDIETTGFSLESDILTIAFSRNNASGIGFHWLHLPEFQIALKNFFIKYEGKKIYHNGPFDTKLLINKLFMKNAEDYEGMLDGLHHMWKNAEDTKAIAFCALNSTADIDYSLKALGQPYAGDWSVDFKSHITHSDLLHYNMQDTAVTQWVFEQYYPKMVAENQEEVYKKVFLPSLKTITLMELIGMPLNIGTVFNVEEQLVQIQQKHYTAIMQNPKIIDFTDYLRESAAEKANKRLKKLRKTKDDFLSLSFNPNSGPQMSAFLHEHLGLPILNTTDKGNPSTSADALKALSGYVKSHGLDNEYIEIMEHFVELSEVSKILSTFINAFKDHSLEREGWHFLHGNFNLGGTISGRLSSSGPNLQNIPSDSRRQYAKIVKSCFQAPRVAAHHNHGWLFVGADYSSLEDRISALLTKDPNKLAVYLHGYDGHCLRAYAYFPDQMEELQARLAKLTEHSDEYVAAINSITQDYPELRQHSKGPTFALTYQGTANTLHKNFGIPVEEAKQIEAGYHELYKVSDEWVNTRIQEAKNTGYVELAFGLKLRTPILAKLLENDTNIPYLAQKEMKSAGNALGQSYGLLNSHTANLFMERVWASKWATKIFPIAQIHDAQYYLIANTLGCLEWVNNNLIECMAWNELEPIQHPKVGLEAALEVFYPDWAHPIGLPNNATRKELQALLRAP